MFGNALSRKPLNRTFPQATSKMRCTSGADTSAPSGSPHRNAPSRCAPAPSRAAPTADERIPNSEARNADVPVPSPVTPAASNAPARTTPSAPSPLVSPSPTSAPSPRRTTLFPSAVATCPSLSPSQPVSAKTRCQPAHALCRVAENDSACAA